MVSAPEACDTHQKKPEKADAAPLACFGRRAAEARSRPVPRAPFPPGALPAPLCTRGPSLSRCSSGALPLPASPDARHGPHLGGSEHCAGSTWPLVQLRFMFFCSFVTPGLSCGTGHPRPSLLLGDL